MVGLLVGLLVELGLDCSVLAAQPYPLRQRAPREAVVSLWCHKTSVRTAQPSEQQVEFRPPTASLVGGFTYIFFLQIFVDDDSYYPK